MHRVKGEQVCRGLSVTGVVVDMHQLNARVAPEGTEHQAADAAEAIDADFHGRSSPRRARRLHNH